MQSLGTARIGQRCPDFHCEAVIDGLIKGKSSLWTPNQLKIIGHLTDTSILQKPLLRL
jgi:hypothetical protein